VCVCATRRFPHVLYQLMSPERVCASDGLSLVLDDITEALCLSETGDVRVSRFRGDFGFGSSQLQS